MDGWTDGLMDRQKRGVKSRGMRVIIYLESNRQLGRKKYYNNQSDCCNSVNTPLPSGRIHYNVAVLLRETVINRQLLDT